MTPADAPFDSYRRTEPDARFTDWLRSRSEPKWSAAVRHRFTREIADGSIDEDVFRRYLEQDYIFVEGLVNLIGHAVSVAPTMGDKSHLSAFLASVTSDENDYFERSFDALGTSVEKVLEAGSDPTTASFRQLFAGARSTEEYVDALAVLVPVEWVYLEWAAAAAAHGPQPGAFHLSEWIELHATDAFRDTVEWLRARLDDLGPGLSPSHQQRVADLFTRAVELEVAFFDAAYKAGGDA